MRSSNSCRLGVSAVALILALAVAPTLAAPLAWDGNGGAPPTLNGGSGTWDVNTTPNWWDGASNVVWPAPGGTNDNAVFNNTAGTVSLAGGITVHNIDFNVAGYTIQNNSLTFNGTTPTITVGTGLDATINSTIAAGTVTKAGDGLLTINTLAAGATFIAGAGTTYANNDYDIHGNVQINTGATFRNTMAHVFDTTTSRIWINGGTLAHGPATYPEYYVAAGTSAADPGVQMTGGMWDTGDNRFGSGTTGYIRINAASTTATIAGSVRTYQGGTQVYNVVGGTVTGGIDLSMTGGLAGDFGGGVTSVVKTGAGLMQVSSANAYTGGTTVSAGTLQLTTTTAAGTGTITLGDANTGASDVALNFNVGSSTLANPITVSSLGSGSVTIREGSNYSTLSGLITLNRPTTFISSASDRSDVSGKITGPVGTLTFTGSPRITLGQSLANASDFTGNVIVSGGTLQLNTPYGLPATASVTVNSGAIFRLVSGANSVVAIDALNGSGSINGDTGGANYLKTLSIGNSNGTGSYSGNISNGGGSDTLAIIKNGTGTQTLTGANSYSGGTTISKGTLQIGNGAVNGTIGGGAYSIAAGATLRLNYATASAPPWANITGAGTLDLNSAQAVNGSANWGAPSLPGGFTGTLLIENGRVDATPTQLGGATGIEVRNTGGQLLAWTGSYSAALTIAGNGWGESGHPGALRSAGGAITTWTGPITLSGDAGINAQNGTTINLNGAITGNYQLEFEASTGYAGTINVTPSATVQNSYGSTKVTTGATVVAGNQYAFSTGALAMNGGTLKLSGYNFSFANLSGASGTVGNYSASSDSTITVGADNSTTSYSGTLVNGGTAALALVKTGTGTMTLSGANTYTGTTTVDGGTLALLNQGTIASSQIINNAAVTLNNTSNGYTVIDKPVAGSGTWTIDGSGAGNNWANRVGFKTSAAAAATATGTITVTNTGKLWFEVYTAGNPTWGAAQSINLNGAGSRMYVYGNAGVTLPIGSLQGNGTVDFYDGGAGKALTLQIGNDNNNTDQVFSGVISNSGGSTGPTVLTLAKVGTGTQILSGANTFTGGISIWNGALSVGTIADSGTSNIGIAGGAGNYLALAGGTLRYTGAGANSTTRYLWIDQPQTGSTFDIASSTGSLTLNPAGGSIIKNVTKTGPGTLTLGGSVAVSSTAAITVNNGTLILDRANSYTGGSIVSAGALQLNNVTAAGTGGITLCDANTGAGNAQVTLNADSIANSITVSNNGTGTATLLGNVQYKSFTGALTVNRPTILEIPNTGAGTDWWFGFGGGGISGTGPIIIKGGAGGPNAATGRNRVVLGGTNSYTGGTIIESGQLQLNTGGAASSGTITLGDANTGSAVTQLRVGANIANNIVISSLAGAGSVPGIGTYNSLQVLSGSLQINHNVELDGGGDRLTWSGAGAVWSGTGDITINGGRVTHDGVANTWTGNMTINPSSTFQPGNAATLTAANSVTDNGTLQLNNVSQTINGLSGSGIVQNVISGNTLTVGAGGADATFTGVIRNGSGTMTLVKSGAGTQVLAGLDTYTGTTTVNQGTLLVNGTHTGGEAYTVGPNATLGGSGYLGTGSAWSAVTANPGGHVAPGNSPGTLHTGTLTLQSGSFFDVQMGLPVWDSLDVTGTVDVTGAFLNLSALSSFASYGGSQYVIVNNDLADSVTGFFAGLGEGASIEAGGAQFTITYHGGTGNDIVLTAVPEPATMALLALAATGLGGYIRRRRACGTR